MSGDSAKVIHIPLPFGDNLLITSIANYTGRLADIGCKASTGKVVDFRSVRDLRQRKSVNSVALIYQDCVSESGLELVPSNKTGRRRYIKITESTRRKLLPKGNYVLIRRISFKEASRRIVACLLLEEDFDGDFIGVENHVNFVWRDGVGMSKELCVAICAYLSCKSIDQYVRRFSGHTQINCGDLNSLPFPPFQKLEEFGVLYGDRNLEDAVRAAENFFFSMPIGNHFDSGESVPSLRNAPHGDLPGNRV